MSAASSAARLLCALLAAAAAGCVQLNTAHCGNNDGDLSCAGATPYCSVCIADNNGCVAEEAAPRCQASSATGGPSTMSTTTDGASSTTTAEVSTTTTTGGRTTTTGGTTTTTGEPPPTCSDGELDPGEQCDGDALGGKDCASVMGEVEFGGGDLACADNCVFDVSGCCLGEDAECQLGGSPSCCEGLNCSLTGGGLDTLTTCR